MIYEISLLNCEDKLIIDEEVFQYLNSDPKLTEIDFIHKLQKGQNGVALYRKEWKNPDGSYVTAMTLVHQLIADRFLEKPTGSQILGFKNGNRLDCRLDNLMYHLKLI